MEYKIKAAFTYKIIKFIEWPQPLKQGEGQVLTISILGDGLINGALSELDGMKVSEWTLRIQKIEDVKEVRRPGILFVNPSEENGLARIIAETRKKGILTVSDMDEFCERGGILNYIIQKDSVSFEINLKEARQSKLLISYKLLNQAVNIYK